MIKKTHQETYEDKIRAILQAKGVAPKNNYTVTVTGTWDIDIKASTPEEAEQLAYQECLADGIDVELMNLEFEAFEENEDGI